MTPTADSRRRTGAGRPPPAVIHVPHHSTAVPHDIRDQFILPPADLADAHSFPTVPLPYEDDQDPRRPDVCIGTDPLHTPHWLRDAAVSLCGPMGRVAVDRPFSGALVPVTSPGRDARVLAVMIEVSRGAYMDETTGLAHAGLDPVRRTLRVVIEALIDILGTLSVVST